MRLPKTCKLNLTKFQNLYDVDYKKSLMTSAPYVYVRVQVCIQVMNCNIVRQLSSIFDTIKTS
ncbi:hypothetical protein VCRA2123E131_70222 [Vibrio crassostreae]|nr:hypothetical protein VCRA2112O114_50222 [Vibrio crassostreae]CAK3580136.1 hypothetical protein VCRA2126E132_70221 [Vibrio crassostreae]CAK3960881.1 hypothetical protein VCRA2123E131_70222 [Vibrio crassostreae]